MIKMNAQNQPLISVIIPTHNRSDYIRKCLDSISEQDYPLEKFEVIVVDDSSTDDTQKILKQYGKKIPNLHIIRNDENRGAAFSRNAGVELSRGDIIANTDSDCILPRVWLRKIEKLFHDPEIRVVQGTQKCEGKWGKFMFEGGELIELYKRRKALDTKNLIIRREIIKRYKFDEALKWGHDHDLGARLDINNINIVYDPTLSATHLSDSIDVIWMGKKNGKTNAIIYKRYGWNYVNPRFKYPIFLLFLFYLGGFFIFLFKNRDFRGALAWTIISLLTAFYFKRNLKANIDGP